MSEDAKMEDVAPPAPPAAEEATSGDAAAAAASAPAPAAASTTEGADATGESKSDAGTATADAPAESKEDGGAGDDAKAPAEGGAGDDAAVAAAAADGGTAATAEHSAESKSDAAAAPADGGATAGGSDDKPASSAEDATDATAKAPAPATSVPVGMVTAAEAAAQMNEKRKAQQEAAAAAAAEAKAAKKRASSKSPTGGAGAEEPKKKKAKKKKKGEELVVSGRRLPTAATRPEAPAGAAAAGSGKKPKAGSLADSGSAPYSAAQAAVNEMMRKALEEDQYSALGSIVDTDSDDDDVGAVAKSTMIVDTATIPAPNSSGGAAAAAAADPTSRSARTSPVPMPSSSAGGSASTAVRLDRTMLQAAMKKRLRIEEQNSAPRTITDDVYLSGDEDGYGTDADDGMSGGGSAPGSRRGSPTPSDSSRRRARRGSRPGTDSEDEGGTSAKSGTGDADAAGGLGGDDDDLMDEFEEASIFGATAGSSNATWVECDKCKKWRRLRGVVDAKKLPSKWYCHMNKGDPERAKCSAPEEEYETPATPESMQDMRTRKHLRLWVRRLQCNEAYESRLPTMTTRGKKRSTTTSAKEPYEWVRCCNPSCGKWRALLRFMDASTVMEQCKNGEWYCVLNTWDEKAASCAAPQENLPAIGCPPWVMQNDDV